MPLKYEEIHNHMNVHHMNVHNMNELPPPYTDVIILEHKSCCNSCHNICLNTCCNPIYNCVSYIINKLDKCCSKIICCDAPDI